MKNKYLWIVVELLTLVGGTFAFVQNVLDTRPLNNTDAAIGASLIVLGVLIRLWRKEFFKS